ncbi:MAG: hypothetical protein WBM28_04165 [Burkholderiales bacterium]
MDTVVFAFSVTTPSSPLRSPSPLPVDVRRTATLDAERLRKK